MIETVLSSRKRVNRMNMTSTYRPLLSQTSRRSASKVPCKWPKCKEICSCASAQVDSSGNFLLAGYTWSDAFVMSFSSEGEWRTTMHPPGGAPWALQAGMRGKCGIPHKLTLLAVSEILEPSSFFREPGPPLHEASKRSHGRTLVKVVV